MTETTIALCDTHDMVVVHRVFRREFGLLPRMIAGVRVGDTERARLVATHATELIDGLHHHHTAEDDLLWPRLLERATLHTELIERMERQHEQIASFLDEAHELLPRWLPAADEPTRARLEALFTQATVVLNEHLADEEQQILPVVEAYITEAEWGQLGEQAMGALPKSRLLVLLGYILEEASPEEQRAFLRKAPPPARLAYRLIGRRKFEREVAQLRAGLPSALQPVATDAPGSAGRALVDDAPHLAQ